MEAVISILDLVPWCSLESGCATLREKPLVSSPRQGVQHGSAHCGPAWYVGAKGKVWLGSALLPCTCMWQEGRGSGGLKPQAHTYVFTELHGFTLYNSLCLGNVTLNGN